MKHENGSAVAGKTVLVAGGGGFIGGHLVDRLRCEAAAMRVVDIKPLDEWHQLAPDVHNVQADLSMPDAAAAAVRGCDVIFNLAADMGGMGFIECNKAACMLSVLTNTNLLLAARDAGVERYFYSSSACVYPADRQRTTKVMPLKEVDAYPADPEDGYGWEKLFSERMCRHFREDFGLSTYVARYHNVYGPHGTWCGGREKAPAALCRKVALAKLSGDHRIDVWGDGEQTRSFTYIDDCIEGTLRLIRCEGEEAGEPLNIGSDRLVRINDLITILEGIAGLELQREYDTRAPQGVRGRNSDNAEARRRLGWQPATSLEVGLELTYRWVAEQLAAFHVPTHVSTARSVEANSQSIG